MPLITLNSNPCWIIVVFFEPDQSCQKFWLAIAQEHNIIIIDNSANYSTSRELEKSAQYTFHNANKGGIAGALNQGLTYIRDHGLSEWCCLFDQDSRPSFSFFSSMLNQISLINEKDKVALCAPVYYETNLQKIADVIEITNNKLKRHKYSDIKDLNIVNATYTITSGSVINLSAWDAIGHYDEALFLDFVDIEWGMRASSIGYKIIVFPRIIMQHTLGDNPIKLWFYTFPNHSSKRHYLYFRNVFLMIKKRHVFLSWKKKELIKLIPRIFIYSFFSKNNINNIRSIFLGMFDGLKFLKR
ncbi:glycosyltransferase [Vibrio eleionomae]|nr:glycosyltransferase [Vibrio eleionomae]